MKTRPELTHRKAALRDAPNNRTARVLPATGGSLDCLKEPAMYHRILVPLDDSAPSDRGLHEAICLAADQKATLFLLHVLDDYPVLSGAASPRNYRATVTRLRRQGSELLARADDACTAAGVLAKTVLCEMTPAAVADSIVDEAGKLGCDLIVMGTHGRRGVSRLTMGSEAELVVRISQVPVLLVRRQAHAAVPLAA